MSLKVFISYSRWNKPFADRLKVDLGRAGVDAWLDTTDITSGRAWRTEIAQGIERADKVVLLASPESSQSQIVAEEVAYARHCGKEPILVQVGGSVSDLKPEWRDLHLLDLRHGAYWDMLPRLFADLSADLSVPKNYRSFLNHPGKTMAEVAQELGATRFFQAECRDFVALPVIHTGYTTTWLIGPAKEPVRLPEEVGGLFNFTGDFSRQTDREVLEYRLAKQKSAWLVSVEGPKNWITKKYHLTHPHVWEDTVNACVGAINELLKKHKVDLFVNCPVAIGFAVGSETKGMFKSCDLYHFASGKGATGEMYERILSVDRM